MLSEESYVTKLINNKHINKEAAVNLFHILYKSNQKVLSLTSDHNQKILKNLFWSAFKRATDFDRQFHLSGTCISIARPIYVVYDNTTTSDNRIRISEALTKGIMQLRDENLIRSTD